jgi:biotin carboxyl carrier protein
MTFEIDVNGRTRVVSVEAVGDTTHDGGRFRVTIGERAPGSLADLIEPVAHLLDARRTRHGVSFIYDEDRRVVEAGASEEIGGACLVRLRHAALAVTVDGRRFRRERAAEGAADGEQRVTAPMPGRVLRVRVQPGDQVTAGQGLITVEAMKMENELVAGRAGRVVEVAVSEGMPVEAGRLLVRLA